MSIHSSVVLHALLHVAPSRPKPCGSAPGTMVLTHVFSPAGNRATLKETPPSDYYTTPAAPYPGQVTSCPDDSRPVVSLQAQGSSIPGSPSHAVPSHACPCVRSSPIPHSHLAPTGVLCPSPRAVVHVPHCPSVSLRLLFLIYGRSVAWCGVSFLCWSPVVFLFVASTYFYLFNFQFNSRHAVLLPFGTRPKGEEL